MDDDHRFKTYDQRIAEKHIRERALLEELNKVLPWKLIPTPTELDKFGYDAIARDPAKTSTILSFQIKERQTGKDILLEVIRPWTGVVQPDRNYRLTGRDMKVTPDFYIFVDQCRKMHLFRGTVLKQQVTSMLTQFFDQLCKHPELQGIRMLNGEIRVVLDPCQEQTRARRRKLCVFVFPESVPTLGTFQL